MRRLFHSLVQLNFPRKDLTHEYGLPLILVELVSDIQALVVGLAAMNFVFGSKAPPHDGDRYWNVNRRRLGPQALHISRVSGRQNFCRFMDLLLLESLFTVVFGVERLGIQRHLGSMLRTLI